MDKRHIVESLCDEFSAELEKIGLEAVTHYYELHKSELLSIRPGTKAALITDYIYAGLKKQFQGVSGFEFIEKGMLRFVGYQSNVLIRVKKLTSTHHKPAVNTTAISQKFNTQQDLNFLAPKPLNVYLGYILSREGGNLDVIAFVCPDVHGAIAWEINVEERRSQRIFEFPEVKSPAPVKRRITAKADTGRVEKVQ